MPINLENIQQFYSAEGSATQHKGWLMMPDSKIGTVRPGAGSSGGSPGNGWKIHISIDPTKMALAAQLIAEELNNKEAPRVSLKFAGKDLAASGQPSKEVAFIFYAEELRDKAKITAFLNRIELVLKTNNIGVDPRLINSEPEALKTKFDAVLLDDKGMPSRFNYRNESCIVMVDDEYEDIVGGPGNFEAQGDLLLVKQSYFLALPESQRHNPGNQMPDPLASIQIKAPILGAPIKPTVEKFEEQITKEQKAAADAAARQAAADAATRKAADAATRQAAADAAIRQAAADATTRQAAADATTRQAAADATIRQAAADAAKFEAEKTKIQQQFTDKLTALNTKIESSNDKGSTAYKKGQNYILA